MELYGKLMVLFAVIVVHGYAVTINTKLGRFFKHEIDFANFVSGSNEKNASVSFTVSQLGFPDLPKWIRLEQRMPTDSAFIYGSPPRGTPDSVKLEVTGWDKRTYNTKRSEIQIAVNSSEDAPRYRVEFHIKDRYIFTFLEQDEPKKFLKNVRKVWKLPDGGPYVTNVYAGLDRGERVPIPPEKESVYVEVGGSREYTVFEKEYTKCIGLKSSSNDQFNPFKIDWCKFSMRDMSKGYIREDPLILRFGPAQEMFQSTYLPVAYDPSARDFDYEWVLVLILPIIIILLIVVILAAAMCFHREGRPKRDDETPGYQLSHHDSILRATFRLRQMSRQNNDDEPKNRPPSPVNRPSPRPQHTSTPYNYGQTPHPDGELDETDASPQYSAPPPYRMPPPVGINVSSPDGSSQYHST